MDQDFIQDIFNRCGVDIKQVIKRTINYQSPEQEPTPIDRKVEICMKMLEDQQKKEKWPSGISTYTINSYPLSNMQDEYEVVESDPSKVILSKVTLTCFICLEQVKKGEKIRTIKCGHKFHSKCIDHWLKLKGKCPLDRACMLNYRF